MAWRALPVRARELLDQKRDTGQYGGVPGQAPYWLIQERGYPAVGISPVRYIKDAVDKWKSEVHVIIRKQIGTYGRNY
jgi:hypothetical protein